MALTIAQASVVGQDDFKDGIVEMFVQESKVLDRLLFVPILGTAHAYNRELTLPGAATRAVNASWVESTGTFEKKTESLKIYGGEFHVDRFIMKTMGNKADHYAAQAALKVKAVTYKVQGDFINGDSATDVNAIDGLKKRMPASQVVDAAATSLDVNFDDASRYTFIDRLQELISKVRGGADALYMNQSMLLKIQSVAARLGYRLQRVEGFGKVVDSFNSVPLLDIGKNADGTEIITNTEPDGTTPTAVNNTTSIYAVKFGEDNLAGLTSAGSGIDAYKIGGGPNGEMESKPAVGGRIEFYWGLADYNDKSMARLRYLK